MPQFYINSDNISNDTILITDKSDIKHITTVLRLNVKDCLILNDDKEFSYKAEILDISKHSITTKVVEKQKSDKKLHINLILAQSILKSSAQDVVVQKATELGTKEIIPLITKYTVVKFSNDKDKEQKIEKWQKIACEACKQCERASIPKIGKILSLKELLSQKENFDLIIACVERSVDASLKTLLKDNSSLVKEDSKILVIIGPEGGWSNEEIELFQNNNIAKASLGNLILRAETATITALSDVIYEYEFE